MKVLAGNTNDPELIDWAVYMEMALELADRVMTATPNPRVGCVIENEGRVIGRGWHKATGQAHAEIMALADAGDEARGSTAYVTLEPCSHQGRTGPCSQALLAAGVARVCIAGLDPNPSVSGEGVALLERGGVSVYHLRDYENRAVALNRGYFKRRLEGLPLVRLKLAMSLDGRTALADGKSKWITGPQARAQVQELRARSSAILTGINTVLEDDPELNVRVAELALSAAQLESNAYGFENRPLRVILDSQRRTPGTARVLRGPGSVKIYCLAGESGFDPAQNVELVPVPQGKGGKGVDLPIVLKSLAQDFECNEVLVEAGPELSGSFIASGLVDELIVFMAPKLLGSDAKPLLSLGGLQELSQAQRFAITQVARVGSDLRIDLRPTAAAAD